MVAALKAVSDADLERYYEERKWRAIQGDLLPPGIDALAFDACTLHGRKQAVLFLQRSVGRPDTGSLDRADIDAAWGVDPQNVITSFAGQRAHFFHTLVEKRPKDEVFLEGWLNRNALVTDFCTKLLHRMDQERLRELGYQVGNPDGVAGVYTQSAVLSFTHQLGAEPTPTLTPNERRVLHSPDAPRFPVPESRKEITAETLVERGSGDVADAQADKKVVAAGVWALLVSLIDKLFGGGAIDGLFSAMDKAVGLLSRLGVTDPRFVKVTSVFVLGFAICAVFWRRADVREERRVEKARSGQDISK